MDRDLLTTTVLTSVTGFMFPIAAIQPAHVVGGISLVVLGIALALYLYRLRASWRWIYIVTAILALYLNVFVGVVQPFRNRILQCTRADPIRAAVPDRAALVLTIFILLGIAAVKKFRPETGLMPTAAVTG